MASSRSYTVTVVTGPGELLRGGEPGRARSRRRATRWPDGVGAGAAA